MKKIALYLFFLIFLYFVLPTTSLSATEISVGMNLDCARAYFSPKEIKAYIDYLSKFKNSFLQLHFTDNENVGLVCETLGQTVENAFLTKKGYKNAKTDTYFLSKKEITSLLSYAKKKRVEIIPEISSPSHVGGFFRLASFKFKEEYLNNIFKTSTREHIELNLSKKETKPFMEKLYEEYASLFSSCKYFHIGGDEVFFSTEKETLSHLNHITAFLKKKGFVVRLWNDSLSKKSIQRLDKSLQITYWSLDGDTQNPHLKRERRKHRASFLDFQKFGFKVLNYNSYYLYYVPSKENSDKKNLDYMVSDLRKNWNLQKWDGTSSSLAKRKNLIGTCISIWMEDAKGVSKKLILKQSKRLFKEMINAIKVK